MKNTLLILLAFVLFGFSACKKCSDQTLNPDTELLAWMPYENGNHDITLVNADGETLTQRITRADGFSINSNGNCEDTNIQEYITVYNPADSLLVFNIWFIKFDEDLVGHQNYLQGLAKADTDNIGFASISVNQPALAAANIALLGNEYEEVLVTPFLDGTATTAHLYLQKNVGLIGLEVDGELWVLAP